MEKTAISLFELNSAIKNVLNEVFCDELWVYAHISEIHSNSNGHCYLDLIQKKADNTIVARQRAIIWANTYKMLKPYFEQTANIELQAGIDIMVCCSVEMHENYGISLNINDINPEYTVGLIEVNKSKILKQLEDDGIIELNKNLEMPLLPQRVAVISSETAAGYEDFTHQILNNKYGFKFYISLFDATMQGINTESSIVGAFDKIFEQIDHFDLVVIIRGGGATAELSVFDSYNIAAHVAQFPLPVVCGIGHQRDNSVLDSVSHTSVKTPTAVAELLISLFLKQYNALQYLWDKLIDSAKQVVENQNYLLEKITYNLYILPQRAISLEMQDIDNKRKVMIGLTKNIISDQFAKMQLYTKTVSLLSPHEILKRGYSIVRCNNRIVRSASEIKKDDDINIQLTDGEILGVASEVKIKN